MDTGIYIALILGAAQIVSTIIMVRSTIAANDNKVLNEKLNQTQKKYENARARIEEFAKMLLFLRCMEESLCKEISQANTDKDPKQVRKIVRESVTKHLGYQYNLHDSQINDTLKNTTNKKITVSPQSFDL